MSTVRETSIETFHDITENGLLSKRRMEVYTVVFYNQPIIGSEVSRIVKSRFGEWSQSETIRNRLTELRDMGVVKELGTAIDSRNGRKVIQWGTTGNLPEKVTVKKKEKCFLCKGKGYIC